MGKKTMAPKMYILGILEEMLLSKNYNQSDIIGILNVLQYPKYFNNMWHMFFCKCKLSMIYYIFQFVHLTEITVQQQNGQHSLKTYSSFLEANEIYLHIFNLQNAWHLCIDTIMPNEIFWYYAVSTPHSYWIDI